MFKILGPAILAATINTAQAANVAGAISYAAHDYAAIYGALLETGELERYHASRGTFCGISTLGNPLAFEWTGEAPVTFKAPFRAIWMISCINPAGPREVTLWSEPGLTRSKSTSNGDPALIEQLRNAMPNL